MGILTDNRAIAFVAYWAGSYPDEAAQTQAIEYKRAVMSAVLEQFHMPTEIDHCLTPQLCTLDGGLVGVILFQEKPQLHQALTVLEQKLGLPNLIGSPFHHFEHQLWIPALRGLSVVANYVEGHYGCHLLAKPNRLYPSHFIVECPDPHSYA
ncbi:MAG: hypothetical protein ABIG95_07125 [Candidatus Woesearchaeota archaeon]